MPLPPEVTGLFADEGEQRIAIRHYACGTIAHRMLKFGWEPEVNALGPRMLIMLVMFLPMHARMPVLMEAWQKALYVKDEAALAMLEKAFGVERVA